mmetsp:Transcript_53917/g.112595  ORF Transcript_53917/g.112595 Transcript_53917/m.112595 type:complete len:241 (-) Transcript_53917:7-729(-)
MAFASQHLINPSVTYTLCMAHQIGEDSGSQFRPRAVLSLAQVIEIYQYRKIPHRDRQCCDPLLGRSVAVAKKFNVSPKTIRDIWNRRSWAQETRHLWTSDERRMIRFRKTPSARPLLIQPGIPLHDAAGYSSALKTSESDSHSIPVDILPHTAQTAEKKPDPSIWRLAPITIKLETQPPPTPKPHPTTETVDAASAILAETIAAAAASGTAACAAARTLATCAPACALADDPFHFDWPPW